MAPCPMISAIPTSPLLHQVLSLASGMAAINLIPGLIRLLPRAVSRCPPAVTQSLTYRECVITSAGVVALKERPDHVSLGRPGGASGATTPKSASAARGEGGGAWLVRAPFIAASDLWLWRRRSCASRRRLVSYCCCRRFARLVFRVCVSI